MKHLPVITFIEGLQEGAIPPVPVSPKTLGAGAHIDLTVRVRHAERAGGDLLTFSVRYTVTPEGEDGHLVWVGALRVPQECWGGLTGGASHVLSWLGKAPSPSELERWFHRRLHTGDGEPAPL